MADSSEITLNREPFSKWKRLLMPHAFAIDYVSRLARYRPFDANKDLDPTAAGYLADTLQTGRLFIPSAEMLNDPWEASPSLDGVWWRRDLHRQIAEFLTFLVPEHDTPKKFAELLAAIRKFDSKAALEAARREMLGAMRQSPILSFSDRSDLFLMWSYYCKGHNGYALVFDAKVPPIAAAVRVRYSKAHPRVLLSRRDFNGIAKTFLATKAHQWRHEREWRIIVGPHTATKIGFLKYEPASPNGFYAVVPQRSIVGLVVGDRLFQSEHWKGLLALLRRHVPRLSVQVAEIDRRFFRIGLRPANLDSKS